MAKVKLDFGAEVDFLTKGELDGSLDRSLRDASAHTEEARLRGIKPMRYRSFPYAAISSTAGYTIQATPNDGYIWSLRAVVVGLSAAQTGSFWLAGDQANTPSTTLATLPPLGYFASATTGGVLFARGQMLMYPGEYVVVSAGGSATLNGYTLVAWETPAELIGKLA